MRNSLWRKKAIRDDSIKLFEDQSISMNDESGQITNKIFDDDNSKRNEHVNRNSSSNSNVFSRLMHSERACSKKLRLKNKTPNPKPTLSLFGYGCYLHMTVNLDFFLFNNA